MSLLVKVFNSLNLFLVLVAITSTKYLDKPKPSLQSLTNLPIVLTVYDTALCPENTPCLQGNGDGYFATMIPVSDVWYGKMAACPPELLGATIIIPYMQMEMYCGDSFGPTVTPIVYGNRGYVRVDVFWPVKNEGLPYWNAWHVSGWYYEWRSND